MLSSIRYRNRDSQGRLHCKDRPAVIGPEGYEAWYFHGNVHRLDGPARTYVDGRKEWFIDDKLIGTSDEGFTQQMFEKYVKLLAFM